MTTTRPTTFEKKISNLIGILFVPSLMLTPELGMFVFITVLNPSSVLEWNPWYYPFGFVSVVAFLALIASSYKLSAKWAMSVWAAHAVFCTAWVFGKLYVHKQGLILSLWFIVCGVLSAIVALKLYLSINESSREDLDRSPQDK